MNTETNPTPNHLSGESSPYLKQHMYNPVDWYPWSEVAFNKANKENKPIFLSIGYSTCHWCHVMAHESFENEEIATYLNKHFVSIKLDREERPDIDQVYQHVIQMMGRRGGWPLSIFMTPDRKPFFAGTYFPNVRKYGMDSFPEILEKIMDLYKSRRHDLDQTGEQVVKALTELSDISFKSDEKEITKDVLQLALIGLDSSIDPLYGGFGDAPKFPNFPALLFAIRQLSEFDKNQTPIFLNLKKQLENTLDKMAAGGIYDHVGGGFARYSVDTQWMIPHFEKMLYDNALALQVYSEAYYLFQKPRYKNIVQQTVEWVLRQMYHEHLGFYSALDADSEGEEGKYYVWTKVELEEVIPKEKRALFFKAYGVTNNGNFTHHTNHLYIADSQLIEKYKDAFISILNILLDFRNKRVSPELDDKILTSWSSLMVKGLYSAYRILNDSKIRNVAHSVLQSLRRYAFSADKKILYRVLDAKTHTSKIPGLLDDYAYFIQALFEDFLYYPDTSTFHLIQELLEIVHEQFWDSNHYGFFYSSKLFTDIENRLKTGSDMPLPNPNSVMAENLLQYHFYLSDPNNKTFLIRAEQALLPYIEIAHSNPIAYGAFLQTLEWYIYGSTDIVITDKTKAPEDIHKRLHDFYIPRLHLLYSPKILSEWESLTRKFGFSEKYSYYFCVSFNCLPPTADWDEFIRQLSQNLISISRKN